LAEEQFALRAAGLLALVARELMKNLEARAIGRQFAEYARAMIAAGEVVPYIVSPEQSADRGRAVDLFRGKVRAENTKLLVTRTVRRHLEHDSASAARAPACGHRAVDDIAHDGQRRRRSGAPLVQYARVQLLVGPVRRFKPIHDARVRRRAAVERRPVEVALAVDREAAARKVYSLGTREAVERGERRNGRLGSLRRLWRQVDSGVLCGTSWANADADKAKTKTTLATTEKDRLRLTTS
jgi:hypothetical protein